MKKDVSNRLMAWDAWDKSLAHAIAELTAARALVKKMCNDAQATNHIETTEWVRAKDHARVAAAEADVIAKLPDL